MREQKVASPLRGLKSDFTGANAPDRKSISIRAVAANSAALDLLLAACDTERDTADRAERARSLLPLAADLRDITGIMSTLAAE
ncbi:hypothetical protein [Sneathiella sp.]|uniref:hypothetical protein n=1 Tax=Sneathiella sp. TaxID=1964365 RepID=UPI003566D5AE